MRYVGFICVCMAFFLGLTATAQDKDKDKDAKTQTLTEKENGSKVKLAKGEIMTIKLEGVPTAGYVWNIAKNNADQLAPQGKPEVTPAKKGVLGGKAVTTFRFKAESAGSSELELHYKRPFEKGKEPAKTFKITVEIK
jgi:inhibitor of cysteine peptidase